MSFEVCCFLVITIFRLVKSEHDVIVVLGGIDENKLFFNEVEVLDPNPNTSDQRVCDTAYLSPYIAPIDGIGGLIDDKVVFCGGLGDWADDISTCYQYDPTKQTWVDFTPMSVSRQNAAFVTTPYGLMVAGNRWGHCLHCDEEYSAEYFNGTEWVNLPKMPFESTQACMAQINKTHTILMGKLHSQTPEFRYQKQSNHFFYLAI